MSVLLFGVAKEIAGAAVISLPENVPDVGALRVWLLQQYPALLELRSLMIAVNREYAADTRHIGETDEIAVIPPVSGG